MKYIRSILLVLFVLGSLTNLGLSFYIQHQKTLNTELAKTSINPCFIGNGGCATVQTSIYANTFGISNPLYGVVVFTILAILFALLLVSVWNHDLAATLRRAKGGFDFVLSLLLGAGALFSLWLLFVQFFLLHATCIFCLWTDGIMISMAILYLIFKDIVID